MVDLTVSHYSTGTATVAAGGTAVTGQGTAWAGAIRPGDLFGSHVGLPIRILSVESNTELTLAHPWPGDAQTAAPYEIQRTPYDVGYRKAIEDLVTGISEGNVPLLAALTAAANKLPYFDSSDSMSTTGLTAFARTLLDDDDGETVLATLGMSEFWRSRMSDSDATAALLGVTSDTRLGELAKSYPQIADVPSKSGFYSPTGAGSSGYFGDFWPLLRILRSAGRGFDINASQGSLAFRNLHDTWSAWKEFWHSANLPLVSEAEAQGGSEPAPRAWPPNLIAAAIEALAPGSVVENGSNSAGYYVRLANGLQLCWGFRDLYDVNMSSAMGSLFGVTGLAWGFPASFSGVPHFGGTAYRAGSATIGMVSGHTVSTSSAIYGVGFTDSLTGGQVKSASFFAIGRWL